LIGENDALLCGVRFLLKRSEMRDVLYCLLCAVILPWSLAAQTRPAVPADTLFYAVTYVDVVSTSKTAAVAALKQYRDASRKDDGYVRLELLEQIGRPAHFVILETWADQKAFDAHALAAHTKQFLSALQPIRSSIYDQRPYKTFTVGSGPPAAGGQAIYVVTHVDIISKPGSDGPGLLRRLAEASRNAEGSARFDILQSTMRANHFTIVETWQSQKALDAHGAAAPTREYRDGIDQITGSPLDERVFKAVE
jgi:quinol monooxygenase YgiN